MYVFSNGQFSVSVLYINENQCQYVFKPVLIKNFIQVTLGLHLSAWHGHDLYWIPVPMEVTYGTGDQ